MVRRSPWFFALVLLAACAQTPNPVGEAPVPPPPTPTVLSTDFSDTAAGVTADAEGNAYVVGYRNLKPSARGNVGEIFVARFSVSGDLEWLTRLVDAAGTGRLFPSVAVVDGALYAVTLGEPEATPVTVHKLALDGTLLWSRDFSSAGRGVQSFTAAPDGTFYLLRSVGENELAISAYDGAGASKWEVPTFADSTGLIAARDGTLYETGRPGTDSVFRVSKRSADGTLQWTRTLTPSLPYFAYSLSNYTTLYAADSGVYAVATFAEENRDFVNKQVTRLDAAGEETWSQLLAPRGQPLPSCDYLSEHCLGVLGVTFEGAMHASRGDNLIYFSPTGKRFETVGLGWYGDVPVARVLIPDRRPEAALTDIFYEVGINGGDEANACTNDSDDLEECAHTDIYVQQSSIKQGYDENGLLSQTYQELKWSSR